MIDNYDRDSQLYCEGIVINTKLDDGMVNAGIPTGPLGGIDIAVGDRSTTIRTVSDLGYRSKEVESFHTLLICRTVLLMIAEIKDLGSWDQVREHKKIKKWLKGRLEDLWDEAQL